MSTPTNKLTTDFGKDKPTSRCQTIHLMSAFVRQNYIRAFTDPNL